MADGNHCLQHSFDRLEQFPGAEPWTLKLEFSPSARTGMRARLDIDYIRHIIFGFVPFRHILRYHSLVVYPDIWLQ